MLIPPVRGHGGRAVLGRRCWISPTDVMSPSGSMKTSPDPSGVSVESSGSLQAPSPAPEDYVLGLSQAPHLPAESLSSHRPQSTVTLRPSSPSCLTSDGCQEEREHSRGQKSLPAAAAKQAPGPPASCPPGLWQGRRLLPAPFCRAESPGLRNKLKY